MLNGYKTYIGILVAGLSYLAQETGYEFDVAGVTNSMTLLAGLAIALFGRYHVEKRNA